MTPEELRRLPKAELHRHLECTLRLSTLRELAPAAGLRVPADDAELKRELLITEPMQDLESVLRKFLATQKVLRTPEILERITFEAIEDASNEGVRILELRYAPTFVREGHEDMSFEMIHGGIVRGLEKAKSLPIAVGLIAIIQRTLSMREAEQVVDFAIAHKDTFVGLDLADNEVGFEPGPFAPLFARAKKAGLHITVHSGEADIPEAVANVRTAIEKLGAERIGHGLQVHRSPEMMRYLRDHQIPLELCPTSNWLTNAVPSIEAHPFRKLMEAGVPVTINSDDPGIFDIDLTNEYRVLRDLHGLTLADFERCNDTAAAHSFLPLEVKQKNWPRPIKPIGTRA